jgi:short-subunit dehydrogenase
VQGASAVIVGASSGVGRALVSVLAQAGYRLAIVARDGRDLSACANDATLRFGHRCVPMVEDIARPDFDAEGLAARCYEALEGVDVLLVPAGGVSAEDVGPNAAVIAGVSATNYLGPAGLAAAFGRRMAGARRGVIVLFSSIAAAAPRTKNLAYSAAKAALEAYAHGLRHALAPAGVEVLVVALGYVDTPQSFGQKLLFPVASPESVARAVLKRISARRPGGGRQYFPWFWWWITTALRYIPWAVYRRLNF